MTSMNMNTNKNKKYKSMSPYQSLAHKILYYTNEAMHAASRDIQIVNIKVIYIFNLTIETFKREKSFSPIPFV